MIGSDVQVLRNLSSILPEWRDLFGQCSQATPFQSPAWLVPWWHFFGRGDPVVIAVHKQNRLVGLGLFYLYDGDPARHSQLFFLGKSVSDYLDILVADGEPASEMAQQIFDCLFEFRGEWQCADLDRLRPSSPVLHVRAAAGVSESRFQEGVCPELPLNGSTIRQIATKNTRNSIRKHMNRARSFGKVEFFSAGRESFPALLDSLIQFHSAHWRSAGVPCVFSDPNMTHFLAEAGMQLLQDGILQLQAMLIDGAPVAVSFGMLHRNRNYFYLCDFNAEYASISPGTLVTAYAIEQAAQCGARHFDFLQGEEKYKYQKWGAQPTYTCRIQFSRQQAAFR